MKGSNFSYLVKQGVVSVWYNRVMSFASFCILMVSLLLIGLAVLFSLDISVIIGNIEDRNEMLVFVDGDIDDSELSYISDVLNSQDYVSRVVFYSKEQAWEDEKLSEKYGSGATALFESVDENPMPTTYRVTLNDITKVHEAAERFRRIEGVDWVAAPYDFAEFLISVRNTFTIIGIAILSALVVVCLVIIYNTARASVFARRMQISIMKHVGATNSFIKFPFFIEGMFIGFLAGTASWYLTKVAYESVFSVFERDIMILQFLGFSNVMGFEAIKWYVLAANCLAGALLGAIGTILSMGKHLKV
ncbi:MAG: permease-like cell division protein FtsX [Oscillospiraceae bacterium]|nr:permease-like cell division protein FtsX [Oscillospiraceae bacterium]